MCYILCWGLIQNQAHLKLSESFKASQIVSKLVKASQIVSKLVKASQIVSKLVKASQIVSKLVKASQMFQSSSGNLRNFVLSPTCILSVCCSYSHQVQSLELPLLVAPMTNPSHLYLRERMQSTWRSQKVS